MTDSIEKRPDEGLSVEEMAAEHVSALPDKEVVSILDLDLNVDLALDAAAPIDLGVAANLNVAAPIEASAAANVLSVDSGAQAVSQQTGSITQSLDADAIALSEQTSGIDQSNDTIDDAIGGETAAETTGTGDGGLLGGALDGATGTVSDTLDGVVGGTTGTVDGATGAVDGTGSLEETVDGVTGTVGDTGGVVGAVDGTTDGLEQSELLSGDLLDVQVNIDLDTDLAAPIAGSVAANANVAAPIDAAVAANVGTVNSDAIAQSVQDVDIQQDLTGTATADTTQDAEITQ